ncbi:MAG: UbiA prenyltransferase family protein [Bradymonadaceae bacterium]
MSDSETAVQQEEGGGIGPTGPVSVGTAARGLVRTLRPHQWVKNLFVLAPLFFSKAFLDPNRLWWGMAAAGLFCLGAGSVYILNDILDVEEDRQHPVKKHRPIPSGELPVGVAWWSTAAIATGVMVGAYLLHPLVAACIGTYMVVNLAYSTVLKGVPFIDVAVIAAGFVLRVLTGKFAVDVYVSGWLLACTFFLALYLALGKRAHELAQISAERSREVLEQYRADHLEFALLFVAGLTIALYTLYTVTAALPQLTPGLTTQPLRKYPTPFATRYLPLTVLFAVFGIVRFYQLVKSDSLESPTELILGDPAFVVNIVLWGATMLVIAFT